MLVTIKVTLSMNSIWFKDDENSVWRSVREKKVLYTAPAK
jgi:hypothetical protein